MKELKAYNKEGENETFLYLRPVNDEDLLHWEAVLKGPAASPYEGKSKSKSKSKSLPEPFQSI
jgi:peroxin-4